jgi:hypothetical protein
MLSTSQHHDHHTSNFFFLSIMLPPTCKMCPQPQQADFCAACPAPAAESWLILIVVGCNKKDIRLVGKGEKRDSTTCNR